MTFLDSEPILRRPAVAVPEHVITIEETLDLTRSIHGDHPQLSLAPRWIENTGVAKRHLVQSIEEALRHPGLEQRNNTYIREAKSRIPAVVDEALKNARLSACEIDAIVFVSCTGFTMSSLTAWMINELGFGTGTRQIPIAQLGCAAGGGAINRAHDFCRAHPGRTCSSRRVSSARCVTSPTTLWATVVQRAVRRRGRRRGGPRERR